jgi:hypothetical protein
MRPAVLARKADAETAKVCEWVEDLGGVNSPGCGVAVGCDHFELSRSGLIDIVDVSYGRIRGRPEVKAVEEVGADARSDHSVQLRFAESGEKLICQRQFHGRQASTGTAGLSSLS